MTHIFSEAHGGSYKKRDMEDLETPLCESYIRNIGKRNVEVELEVLDLSRIDYE